MQDIKDVVEGFVGGNLSFRAAGAPAKVLFDILIEVFSGYLLGQFIEN